MKTLNFYNVSWMCAGLEWRSSPVRIDLTDVSFVKPFALVYLGMVLRHYSGHGYSFELIESADPKVKQYLARQRFYERFRFNINAVERERLIRMETTTSLNDIVDIVQEPYASEPVIENLLQVLVSNNIKLDLYAVCDAVAEVIDNFAQHAEHRLAAMMVQYYPKKHILSVAIGDCGVGIRRSLATNPRHAYLVHRPHNEAIREAFKPLVSRRAEGGTGLSDLKDFILDVRGYLYCSSNDGYVRFDRDGTARYGNMAFDLPGVQMEFGFPEEL